MAFHSRLGQLVAPASFQAYAQTDSPGELLTTNARRVLPLLELRLQCFQLGSPALQFHLASFDRAGEVVDHLIEL